VERHHRSGLTLVAAGPFSVGVEHPLDENAAHHVQVRRAREGDAVRLVDGAGRVAEGLLTITGKRASVAIAAVAQVPRPPALQLLVPVADRDRMLVAAEKAVELQATAWRPVLYGRSRSVASRGEGEKFREKVAARMRSALEQSGGAWLPDLHDECALADAMHAVADAPSRLVLDAAGTPLAREGFSDAVALAVGPEGGLEDAELAMLRAAGWVAASLGHTTLRFETALIAGVAVIRAAQHSHGRS
jgi:16S rRNA (uracil1498-N3)-methyltransferase